MSNLLRYIFVAHKIQIRLTYQVSRKFFIMLTVCGLSLIFGNADVLRASDDPDTLYNVVVGGINENSKKLKCAALTWQITERRKPSNVYPEGPEAEGIFRLWWDGNRIATKSNHNLTGIEEQQIKYHTVYDGKVFQSIKDVKKPTSIGLSSISNYMPLENWFEHVDWPGPPMSIHTSIVDDLNTFKELKDILCTWSVAEMDGSELIKLVSRNTNMKEGTYGVRYFDPSKGFNLVCRESYFDGKMKNRETVELHRFSEGAWFPVETNVRFLDPNTGTAIIHRTMKIDLKKSSFNDPSMIPADVFHINITNDMMILDHRLGEPPTVYKGENVEQFLKQGRQEWSVLVREGACLPGFDGIEIDFSADKAENKMMLICFFDMNQRPSRNCILQLSKRTQELKAKDVAVIAVQASKVDDSVLNELVKKNNITFSVGMIQDKEEKIRFTWGVRSLPHLILTDTEHIIRAEGFAINELEEKIKSVNE